MVRVGDYVTDFLESINVKHIFTVTGGGAMFLNDGIAKSNIKPIFCHHEQACTMAAVAYSKLHNKIGVVMPTTGCAGTNTITGILDAWQDSNKLLVISGQVNKKEATYFSEIPLRKLGPQEANIVSIVQTITKFAVTVEDPKKIKYYLEKAVYLCSHGRPGPVWIDIPLDIQGSYINPNELESYTPLENSNSLFSIEHIIKQSKRPIILAGYGIHLANARNKFLEFVEKYKIPVVCTYCMIDLLPTDHPQYVGRVGIKGTRAGNFAIQNSDLVLSIGSSLNIPVIGYQYKTFAREAKIVVVDVDENEHKKDTIKINHFIQSDALHFLESNMNINFQCNTEWGNTCIKWRDQWPVGDGKDSELNLYTAIKTLSNNLHNGVFVTDAGLAYYAMGQSCTPDSTSRYIVPGAQAEMGFVLPAVVGLHFSDPNRNIVGVVGDGSFQLNLQELQTIVHYKVPAKLFVLNNDGYLSIRNTQDKFFEGRRFGSDAESGLTLPCFENIANAYGLKYYRIKTLQELKENIKIILSENVPVLCELIMPLEEQILPTSATKQTLDGKLISQPLENMYPFLSEEEFCKEMIIKLI